MIIDVIDLKLKDLNLSKQYETRTYRKGVELYNSQSVDIVEVDKKAEGIYTVKSRIVYYGRHNVDISINGNMVLDYHCDCADFEKGNVCAHIIATCMEALEPHGPNTQEGRKRLIEERQRLYQQKVEEERKRIEYERKYFYALRAIETYKDTKSGNSNSGGKNNFKLEELYKEARENSLKENLQAKELATNIRIEPQLVYKDETSFDVSFKMGQTTMYSVKDFCELYNAFKNESILTYGKKLSFEAKRENFAKEDIKFLDYILNYAEKVKYDRKIHDSEYRYYRAPNISNKSVRVFEEQIDEFFEIVKNRKVEITCELGRMYYELTEEKIDIKVELKKLKEREYKLKLNIKDYVYFLTNKNIYLLLNQKIYKIDKKENNGIFIVLNLFKHDGELLVPEDKIDEFTKYIFPKINKFLEATSFEKNDVYDVAIVEKLASKMYLDLDKDDNIKMELKFCYGDYEYNILDKNYLKYIEENKIQRNAIEEKKVLTRIFTDGFELVKNKDFFLLKELDATYEFLSSKIQSYMNDFEILVTDKFKNKEIKRPKIPSVSVKLNNGLLELDISKLDFDINEIKDVLKNYNIKKKYYKLKNGDFLSLEQNEDLEFLNDMSNSFDINYDKMDTGIIKLPANRSIYLEQLLKNNSINTNKNNDYNDLVNNIANKSFSENIEIDKNFEKVLRDYQKVGYKWLKVLENYHFGGILADDMGLGKTLQVIALIASKSDSKKTSIVVCPSSLSFNWKAEIEKWCPKIKVCIIKGDVQSRKDLINSYNKYDLLVTSYDLLKRDIEEYEGKSFKYIIADEAQYIKNFTTQNATALKSLEGESKFALTGTPIENSVSELWSIFDFIMPGYLYSYNKFKKKIQDPILKLEDKEALNRLKKLINPFILRRVKKDVLTELPEKNVTIMKNEMTDEQQKLYMSYFVQTKKEIMQELNENGFEKSKLKILMLLTRLRQICCHPSLFIDNYEGESGKLNQCIDLIKEAIASGHKILLFSSYTSMFNIIEKSLNESNIEYFKLTGNTNVSKRVEMVDEFNNSPDVKIFLISLKAGGTGLNLTGADVVIHFDPWWNASIENQATDRAYRIGQKNSVQVYKLITTNSIEEKINKLQEKKAKISEQLLSTEEVFINKLSKEEIMELFE